MAKVKNMSIEATLAIINKQYGEGSILQMGNAPIPKIDVIPTGIIPLDRALGCGGIPKGRITEIYGAEMSSKTTLALHSISEAQKRGETVAFIDVEHALDLVYAKNLGVDTEALLVSQPSSAEEALAIVEILVASGNVGMIVIDSVAAFVPIAELEGDFGDSHMGLVARLMSQAMRKLTGIISDRNVAAVFINQIRSKIGIVYGNPMVTSGGFALKFYSSVRIECSGFGKIIGAGGEKDIIGKNIRFKIVKNKLAPPFKVVECPLIYGEGISKSEILIEEGIRVGIIIKSGSWFALGETKIGHGIGKVRQYLKDNPDAVKIVEKAIKKKEK